MLTPKEVSKELENLASQYTMVSDDLAMLATGYESAELDAVQGSISSLVNRIESLGKPTHITLVQALATKKSPI